MTTSEPTTGEFNIDYSQVTNDALVCGLRLIMSISPKWSVAVSPVIDRIQLQEITIMEKDAQIATLTEKVGILENDVINFDMNLTETTARAEQSEAAIDLTAIRIMRYIIENDVEIEEWNEPCVFCEHTNSNHGKCGSCYSTEGFELRHDLRGLPQDGEGK